ncbi:MAG: FG-GAP repeat protein, partial [Thermoplasmata archaeon]|nr:FG-GAP repeat protein [Thermoplasmata archaeon]
DEIIIGAPYADGFNNGQRDAGEIYIIYGSGSLPKNIYTRLDEHDVIAYGIDSWDNFGFSLTTGSVDGDKYADLIMGARGGNGEFNGKGDCGDNYLIVVNTTSSFGDDIDLITESSTFIYGIDSGDNSGRFLHFGDLDGDGLEDILIGGPYADGPDNARDSSGEFYVIYSAPPPVSNDWLNLIDGDQNDKTIFSRYRPYTFRVNVSNILGYKDFKSVTLSIDPQGYNISYRWIREANEFERVRDTYAFAECVSGITDVKHDGLYNYSIDFKLNFNWNFSLENLIDCQVTTDGILSFPDTDTYLDVFEVNNELIFKGDLKLEGGAQGKLNPGDWVAGAEKLTFSGLSVAYNSTNDYYPPKTEYSLGIGTTTQTWSVTPTAPGMPFTATITTPAETVEYFYNPQILGIPTENDESNINFTLQVDNDPPAPPSAVTIKADSMNDLITAEADNDGTIFVSWPDASDSGSGIKGYYYGFTDHSGTDNGLWTEETNVKLVDAAEGPNSVYIWSSDNVGNIGSAISGQIFIDLTEATFDNFAPVTDGWLTSNQVNCTIQVFDQDGFGVDIENITYQDMNSRKWLPVNIDIYDNQSFNYANVSVVAELPDGTESFIQFRAVDRTGNGPAESEK